MADCASQLLLEVRFALRRNELVVREVRELVLQLAESGLPQRRIAELIGVPYGTLTYWIRVAREERNTPGASAPSETYRRVDTVDLVDDIRYALQRVTAEARRARCLVLELCGEWPQREVAAALGVPHGTLLGWLRLARAEQAEAVEGTRLPRIR